MRNFLIASVMGCFLSSICYAQANLVKFKAGPENETPRTNEIGYAGNVDLGIVNLSTRRGKMILTRFNPTSLTQSNQGEVELNKDRNFNSEFVANMSGKCYWLSSEWQNEREKLYAAEIDPKNCTLKEQGLILEAPKMAGDLLAGGIWYSASKTVNKYQFNYSTDRKFLLVSYRLIPETHIDKNNFDRIGLQVFDENMKKVWGNEFTMPYTTARMENAEFNVDHTGNVYVISKIYNTDARKEKIDGQPGFHYELLSFGASGNTVKPFTISAENYTITSSYLVEGTNNELFTVSGCNKSGTNEGIDGFYILKMDVSGNLVKFNTGFYELPLEELAKFDSKKTKRRKAYKGEGVFKIRTMSIQSDGSFFMSGEDYARVFMSTASGYQSCYWYYDNITAIKFNADGKAAWVRQIPKQTQNFFTNVIGEYPGQMSYMPFTDESGYYFLFNDHVDNFNLKDDEDPKLFRDGDPGNLVMVKLDQDGKVSKQILFVKDERQKIFPVEFTKLTSRQFVSKCWNGSKEFIPMLVMFK